MRTVNDLADQERLIVQHPRLYHMAESGAWENIRRHGLLSTTALLKLFSVSEPQRSAIETEHRRMPNLICHPEYGCATIRDQTPMHPDNLKRVLTDMEPGEWYQLLNGKVFFWSTKGRLQKFLQARAHRDRPHDVLTVCTRSLVEQYATNITLSHINSGTVRHVKDKRGSDTFRTIADYRRKTRDGYFAELAVEWGVPDIKQHTLSVDRWMGEAHQKRIWPAAAIDNQNLNVNTP